MKRFLITVLLAFAAGYSAGIYLVLRYLIEGSILGGSILDVADHLFALALSPLMSGMLAACGAGLLSNWWEHSADFSSCRMCGRPRRFMQEFCECQHDEPWVRKILAARARRSRQRFRHVRRERVAHVALAYAVVAVAAWISVTRAPGMRNTPLLPNLLVTHVLLCYAVISFSRLGLMGADAIIEPRGRWRRFLPRLRLFLRLFATWPLGVLPVLIALWIFAR